MELCSTTDSIPWQKRGKSWSCDTEFFLNMYQYHLYYKDTYIPMCKCPVKWETQKSPRKMSIFLYYNYWNEMATFYGMMHVALLRWGTWKHNSMARNSFETSLPTIDIFFILNVYLLLSFLKKVVIKIIAPQITPNTT